MLYFKTGKKEQMNDCPMVMIDSREKNENIKNMFDFQNEFEISVEKLDFGDISFGGTIAIERKTPADLINSIRKEDFWSKLFILKEHYKIVYLWCDSIPQDFYKAISYRNRSIWNSIEGTIIALDSLGVIYKEFPISYAGEYFTKVFKRTIKKKDFTPRPTIKKKGKSLTSLRLAGIMAIEGVGFKKAVELLGGYSCPGDLIVNLKGSTDKKLQKVRDYYWKK